MPRTSIHHLRRAAASAALLLSASLWADGLSPSLRQRCIDSLADGAEYLIDSQNENGSWGESRHPALSALAAMGLHEVGEVDADARDAAIKQAMDYVLTYVPFPADKKLKPRDYYPNYTASVALLAMATLDKQEYLPHMRRARQYLQDIQFDDPDKVDYGGIGYSKSGRADLSNTSWAVQALHFTDHLDQESRATSAKQREEMKETYERMTRFLNHVQNLPETNDQPYVSRHPDDRGGFFYRPHESKAGERENPEGKKSLISSGSMTYAGLLSMVYCDLDTDDIRVQGALDYARRHYTVTENPSKGMEAYYFYLHIMSKALAAHGQDELRLADGTSKNWRKDIAERLLELQKDDGSWINENGRFMESMPSLVTSYNLVTLKIVVGDMQFGAGADDN